MSAQFDAILAFMDSGGSVLWAILLLCLVLWLLLIERVLFFYWTLPGLRQHWLDQWTHNSTAMNWQSQMQRQRLLSEAQIKLDSSSALIRVLIAIAPLLGLLGTVTGMIHVFDVMAMDGTGNARAMASGVSRATIPTMAGMVVAITGLFFEKRNRDKVSSELRALSQHMHIQPSHSHAT